MSSKQSLLSSQHRSHPSTASENERRSANVASTVPAVLTATRFAIQRETQLGIVHSPYATAQRQRIAALTQRQASAAPPLVEDEESPAAQMHTLSGTAIAPRDTDSSTNDGESGGTSQRVVQRVGLWGTTKWLAGQTAGLVGAVGGGA
ncbi:MAG: hypothetical protein ACKO15_06150, partial [Burkholderiales bacterium]